MDHQCLVCLLSTVQSPGTVGWTVSVVGREGRAPVLSALFLNEIGGRGIGQRMGCSAMEAYGTKRK